MAESLRLYKPHGQAKDKPSWHTLCRMDALDLHRKRRLEALIAAAPYRGRSEFLRRTGLSKGRVSQLLDPDTPFGERAARALAARIGMEDTRYFEREAPEPPMTQHLKAAADSDEIAQAVHVLDIVLGKLDTASRIQLEPLASHWIKRDRPDVNFAQSIVNLLTQTSSSWSMSENAYKDREQHNEDSKEEIHRVADGGMEGSIPPMRRRSSDSQGIPLPGHREHDKKQANGR